MNVVVLVGRLTDHPELRKTSSDISVTRFSIAVDRPHKSGEDKQTDFINISAWRQTAEFICRYFTKGQRIAIEGSLHMNKFTDKDGNNRTTYEVVANNVHFVESKKVQGDTESQGTPNPANDPLNAVVQNLEALGVPSDATDDDLPF